MGEYGANPNWKKGMASPNPKGQGTKSHRFGALCKEASPEALDKIKELMRQTDDLGVSLKAAITIIERAWGKPKEHLTVDSDGPVALVTLTDDQLMDLASRALGAPDVRVIEHE